MSGLLNPRQEEAVREPGSVVITAGAGTGKTHVLSARYTHLLETNSWSPLNIVAVTFTEKAADELRARIRKTVAADQIDAARVAEVDAAQISTIHALAARICRDFYHLAGIPADFRLMDNNESQLWTLGTIEEAIGHACEDEARQIGYTFLLDALSELLADAYTSEQALRRCSADHWRACLAAAKERAESEFASFLTGSEDVRKLRELNGAAADKIDILRRQALAAVDAALDGDSTAVAELCGLALRGGSAANWNGDDLSQVKAAIGSVRNEAKKLGSVTSLEIGADDEKLLERLVHLRSAFIKARAYLERAKLDEKFLDFNDLETYALKILEYDEAVSYYRERWKAFLIDEFQDTSPIQAELLSRLVEGANVTIVGDEKQSIYGFRGADSRVCEYFTSKLIEQGAHPVVLDETYRTNASLVEVQNGIFAHLLGQMHQPLRSERSYEGQAGYSPLAFAAVLDDAGPKAQKQNVEARHLARAVRRMVDARLPVYDKTLKAHRPARYGDFAVLSRAWDPLETYGDAMTAEGVPAVNSGGGSLVRTREFKDAAAMLTFLCDQMDDLALACVLRSPFFAVSDKALYEFAITVERDASWWPTLLADETLCGELSIARDKLELLIKERSHHSPEGLLRYASALTGYAAVIANLPHGQRREADWAGTLQFVRGLQQKGWEDLFSVVRFVRLALKNDLEVVRPTVESGNAVSLMTVHGAKGLEWPIVFVPDLSRKPPGGGGKLLIDREMGVAFSLEDGGAAGGSCIHRIIKLAVEERDKAERRRLLYVAITRAGDAVRLSSAEPKGGALDLLSAGLAAAAITTESIAVSAGDLLPPAPGEPAEFSRLPSDEAGVAIPTESVMATGIAAYSECPRKYKYRYVDGHPGVGEGSAAASTIGTLAHLALELDINAPEELALRGGCNDKELVLKGLELAREFRSHQAFAGVRGLPVQKELRFSSLVGEIRIYGIADLVGDDFVLDYKTDAAVNPAKHGLQLWAYARALSKRKAYIAYLRHGLLHEIDESELSGLDAVGHDLLGRLRSGQFEAIPSPEVCSRCNYGIICSSRAEASSGPLS